LPAIAEIILNASRILRENGIAEPRREANSLLAFALEKDKAFLIAYPDYELSDREEKRFNEFLQRRARREPFQYITGKQEFYGLDFMVTPDVLIPRPETEIIVENAIEILREMDKPVFCEVGTGSGCISVSILHNVKTARAIGLDISEKALKIAAQNAGRHRVSDRLELKISDVFTNLKNERFDLIVSNPPYISSEEMKILQAEVRDFEPETALTDGRDGLSIIERIIAGAPNFLKPGGYLLMEIGFNQSEKAREMFAPDKWQAIDFLLDLQGIPRTIKAKLTERERFQNAF
jgi:release factor glutamine methyltransferase